jgi:hypothetical protein
MSRDPCQFCLEVRVKDVFMTGSKEFLNSRPNHRVFYFDVKCEDVEGSPLSNKAKVLIRKERFAPAFLI